jgi:hypothetical protein
MNWNRTAEQKAEHSWSFHVHTRTLIAIAKVGEQEVCEMKLEVERLTHDLAIAQSEDTILIDTKEKTEDWTEGCDDTAFHVATKVKMSKFGPNTWLGDSGASSHCMNNDVGMFDVQVINEPIQVGNGNCMIATKIGKLRRAIIQRDGKTSDVVLKDVKYVPQL